MGRADNYSLLLLAGGKSSRMGTNKAELLYEGKSFLENIIEKAKCLGLKELYISGYQRLEFPRRESFIRYLQTLQEKGWRFQ